MKIKLLYQDLRYLSKFGDLNEDLMFLDDNIKPDVIMSVKDCDNKLKANQTRVFTNKQSDKLVSDLKTITQSTGATADEKLKAALRASELELSKSKDRIPAELLLIRRQNEEKVQRIKRGVDKLKGLGEKRNKRLKEKATEDVLALEIRYASFLKTKQELIAWGTQIINNTQIINEQYGLKNDLAPRNDIALRQDIGKLDMKIIQPIINNLIGELNTKATTLNKLIENIKKYEVQVKDVNGEDVKNVGFTTGELERYFTKSQLELIDKIKIEINGVDNFIKALTESINAKEIAEKRARELTDKRKESDQYFINIKDKPLYLKELLKENLTDSGIDNIKKLYDTLTQYNNKLMNVGMNDLYKTVKDLIKTEITTGSGNNDSLNDFADQIGISATNAISEYQNYLNQKPTSDDVITNVFEMLSKFYTLKDSVFPVRIVINFGINYNKNISPVISNSIVTGNYDNSINGQTKNNFQNLINKDIEGPYYTVTNTSSLPTDPRTYNVNADIEQIFTNPDKNQTPHIIYSAYGFSGSGKSYTLIDSANKNNVLQRIVNTLKEQQKKNDKQIISLKYCIYDYYGEIKDDGCNVLTDTNKFGVGTTVNARTAGNKKPIQQPIAKPVQQPIAKSVQQPIAKPVQQPSKKEVFIYSKGNGSIFEIGLNDVNQILIDLELFNTDRMKNNTTNSSDPTLFRVRYTPNNDKSSRSHLFLDIDIMLGRDIIGRITLIDMAGSENVKTIQESYFENLPSKYNSDNFIKSLQSLSGLVLNISDFVSKMSSKFNIEANTPVSTFASGSVKKLFDTIKIASLQKEGNGSYILKDAWKNLLLNLNKKLTEDQENFINNYNLYNYWILVQPIIEFKKTFVKNFGPYFSNVSNNVNTEIPLYAINNFFKKVGIPPIEYNYINVQKFIDDARDMYYKDTIADYRDAKKSMKLGTDAEVMKMLTPKQQLKEENLNNYAKAITELLTPKITSIPDIIIGSNGGKLGLLINKNAESLTEEQKDMLLNDNNASTFTNQINTWNREYLYKIHCPIRYQGNFINQTLEQMKTYIMNTQKNPTVKDITNFPGEQLNNNSRLSKLMNSKTKFILFVNIRLDFQPDGDSGIKPGSETQNENIKQAYSNSIEFANKINPLSKGLAFGKKRKKGPSKIQKVKRIMKDIKYLIK